MDFSRYAEQRGALASYANVPEIPSDTSDPSVDLARRLTSYADDMKLTSRQQMSYDKAVKKSGIWKMAAEGHESTPRNRSFAPVYLPDGTTNE